MTNLFYIMKKTDLSELETDRFDRPHQKPLFYALFSLLLQRN